MNLSDWEILSHRDCEILNLGIYTWEVMLINKSAHGVIDSQHIHPNAQGYFTKEELSVCKPCEAICFRDKNGAPIVLRLERITELLKKVNIPISLAPQVGELIMELNDLFPLTKSTTNKLLERHNL